MKFFAVLAVVLAATQALDLDTEWEKFKLKYNKNLLTADEHDYRKNIFANNLKFIEKHNAEHARGLKTFTVGINKFADLTNEEFVRDYIGYGFNVTLKTGIKATTQVSVDPPMPETMDWRERGAVTEVKNQAQCGSCWAFSTTGVIEGANYLRNQKLVSLSEQNLVDCVTTNGGCMGGWPSKALKYVQQNGGIDTEESYPYQAYQYGCSFNANNVGATVRNFGAVKQGDEADLKEKVALYGPVSVVIDASKYSFQLYKSGVYYDPSCLTYYMEHAVLAVGYDSDATVGMDYWIVKNSWGGDWGNNGYINMARNEQNHCGIATTATYAWA